MGLFKLLSSVAEALSRGALGVAAGRLYHGTGLSAIADYFTNRHRLSDEVAREQMMTVLQESTAAARDMMSRPHDEPVRPDLVPILQPPPQRFFEGARYSYDVEIPWESKKTGQRGVYRIRHVDFTGLTYDEIMEQMHDRFREYKDSSPKNFLPGEELDDIILYLPIILDVVRAY